jgi:RimJ/RimL family protein N-acetyltransferase
VLETARLRLRPWRDDDLEALSRTAWGRGLATESGRAVVRFGFEVAGLDHIAGISYPPNLASQRVLAKCGLRYLRDTRYHNADVHYFAITREEWQAEEGRL